MEVDCRYAGQGAHLRTAHQKVRTQKKHLTLETYRASAPRIHLKPGWNRGPGGCKRRAGKSTKPMRSDPHKSSEHRKYMP